ncbi:PAH2 domain-containing protein [Clavulina sp. PMI_390]|nr:PAH2 domain-containing protein [Clavulina sp. PMI_390]
MSETANFSHAIQFLGKVKSRFSEDPNTYKVFLAILESHRKEGLSIQETHEQVNALFQHDPDLIQEFNDFLPNTPST